MPVFKYRSISDVPSPALVPPEKRVAQIRALWKRSFLFSPPHVPRGVARFRSIEEAAEARHQATLERMRATRARKP